MLSGCRPFGFWAIRPYTFKLFFLAVSRPLAAGHILTLRNFKDPVFCQKMSVCQDSDVEWMPPAWIVGHTSLHFQVFLFWLCLRLWPLATFIDVSGSKAWTGQIFSTSERATPIVSFEEEHVGAFLTLYSSAI